MTEAEARADPNDAGAAGAAGGAGAAGDAEVEDVRTFAPVDPTHRPRRLRRTARVLLIDDRDRILLFADTDPGIPGSHWWITPGGGVEPGETDRQAAARELLEETGAVVDQDALMGPVATRRAIHGYTDVIVDQDEVFFGVTVPAFAVSVAGHTEEEKLTLSSFRWWSRDELAATDDQVWPASVGALWDRFRAAPAGSSLPVLDLGLQEESTVPSGSQRAEPWTRAEP